MIMRTVSKRFHLHAKTKMRERKKSLISRNSFYLSTFILSSSFEFEFRRVNPLQFGSPHFFLSASFSVSVWRDTVTEGTAAGMDELL